MRHSRFSPGVLAAALFTAAYLAVAIVAAIATGNREFIFYIIVMVVLIGAILAVHARIGLTVGLLWCLAIWGALHMAGGLMPVPQSWPINGEHHVLYSWWIIPKAGESGGDGGAGGGGGYLKYDHITHAFGFGTTTWLCWQGLRGAMRRRMDRTLRPTFGLMVLVAAAACGFGALNEIVEFIATMIADTNVGGYVNTGWDLVANASGAVIAAVLIALTARR